MNIAHLEPNSPVQGVPPPMGAPKRDPVGPSEAGGEATFSSEQTKRMIVEIQSQIQRMNVSLEFTHYGERGEKIAVVVADKATGEVIREIPSKEIQHLYSSINELVGLIFNRQA